MAKRRMFSLQIVDSDAFLDLPLSAQALYFHLGMRADDDGFINNANRICRTIGSNADDLKLLILKKFLIEFESGVKVIKHWRMNNYLPKDRYVPTVYQDEFLQLEKGKNKPYHKLETEMYTKCIQTVYTDKNRIDKNRLEYTHTHITLGEFENVNLYEDEKEKLIVLYGKQVIDDYIERLSINKAKTGKEYESDYAVLMEWLRKDNVEYI